MTAGAQLLDDVAAALARYVAFPSEHALVAVTLWAAHSHAVKAFESTPRLAFLSAEKGSGKTRALEVLNELVPAPMHAVNCSVAALFRAVSVGQPTVLFDECDTYLGAKVAQHHEELRGLINAGHRRGAVAYRCVGEGSKQDVRAFPAFAAVALAGIGDLPDTILDRTVVIRMRRRAPDEQVEQFRHRRASKPLHALRERMAKWGSRNLGILEKAEPAMPEGITDRPADVWEPLLAIADLAGGAWPSLARAAAVALNAERAGSDPSLGVRLLSDLRDIFDQADTDTLPTEAILKRLVDLEESPWGDLRGRELDARGLARRLRAFGVKPGSVRVGEATKKGYQAEHLRDPWSRYLPPGAPAPAADSGMAVPDTSGTRSVSGTRSSALTSGCAAVPDVPDNWGREGKGGSREAIATPSDDSSAAETCAVCGSEAVYIHRFGDGAPLCQSCVHASLNGVGAARP